MRRYKHLTISGTLSVETTGTILSGTREEPKKVLGILVTEITDTEQNNAVLRAYKNTERVLDMPIYHLLQDDGGPERSWSPFIPLELDLEAGDTLEVGHVSGGTASDIDYVAVYE